MDPATIIGTTSAILSFIQFSGAVISVAYKIYESSDGAVDDNQKLEEAVTEFRVRLQGLRPPSQSFCYSHAQAGSSAVKIDAERSLLRTASQCETLGNKILEVLNKTKAKVVQSDATQSPSLLRRSWRHLRKDAAHGLGHPSKTTMVEAVRASVQTVWQKDKVDALRQQWESCVSRLNMDLQRLDTEGKHDIICRAFQKNSEQVGKIGDLLEMLVQHHVPQLECLRSFLGDFKKADTLPRLMQRNVDWILRALEFEGMNARRDQVEGTVGNTFAWLIASNELPREHPQLKVSLKKWLSDGAGVYHVTGKPGSGKSTLMKLIDRAATVRKQLESWASRTGDRLIVARFYTWKAANAHRLQNQEEGLNRTLLHQILTAAPELTQIAFAKHPCWNPQEYSLVNLLSRSQGISAKICIEPHEILTALESLLCVQGYRFFLLIDGMDEFEKAQNHHAIAERVLRWSSRDPQRVKTCVSSREENAFMGKFSADQRLRLHIVTARDVRQLVEARLMEHRYFAEASSINRELLVSKLVGKAEGVFLWVVLTIQELKILMDDRQSFQLLWKEVDRFPPEMGDFLREILSRIPEAYREESKAIFSVAITRLHEIGIPLLNLFHYSMLRKCIESDDLDTDNKPSAMSLDEAVSQIKEFRFRLPSLCKGLLETAKGRDYKTSFRDLSDGDSCTTLRCSHRSVFDFLRNSFANAPVSADFQLTSEGRGMLLALHSVIKVMKASPWDEIDQEAIRMNGHYLGLLVKSAQREMRLHPQLSNSIFPLFKTLETLLLRKQGAISATIPFNPTMSDDRRLDSHSLSVFSTAFQEDFCEYIRWALENYPPWYLTREAKSFVVRPFSDQSMVLSPISPKKYRLPIRCLTEVDWLSINEAVLTRENTITSGAQLQQASIWVSTLLWYMIGHRGHLEDHVHEGLCIDLEAGLSAGAEPRIRFKWWSQAEYAAPHIDSNSEADPARKNESSFDTVEAKSLGSEFGVTIEVGDTQKPELSQGSPGLEPRWPEDKDTTLIVYLVSHFRKPSGTATLKDVLAEILLKPDMRRCCYKDDEWRTSWYERRLEIRRRCLKAIDDALVRVGEVFPIGTHSDLSGSVGTNEDGQNPVTGETTSSDLQGAKLLTPDVNPSLPLWFDPKYYFSGWQLEIVVISTLGKSTPCRSWEPTSPRGFVLLTDIKESC